MPYLVTVSPKGQITIPVAVRVGLKAKKYYLDVKAKNIILRPARIFVPADAEKPKERGSLIAALLPEDKKVYEIICAEPCTADELCYKSKLGVPVVNCALTILEMKRLVRKNDRMQWESYS